MAGGDVITKGASKRTDAAGSGTRAGDDVITKGPAKKESNKTSTGKSNRISAKKTRRA